MTVENKVQNTIQELIRLYNEYALSIQENPNQLQGVYLSTEYGYVYVRNMARGVLNRQPVLCLATIDLDLDIQNKGVLSSLIKHIEENPFTFTELEVENIHSQFLVDSLVKKDFLRVRFDPEFPLPLTVLKFLVDKD